MAYSKVTGQGLTIPYRLTEFRSIVLFSPTFREPGLYALYTRPELTSWSSKASSQQSLSNSDSTSLFLTPLEVT